jgi:tetratricopeptide (TPR) repeat protein
MENFPGSAFCSKCGKPLKFSNNHQNRDNFPQMDKIGPSQDSVTGPPVTLTPNPVSVPETSPESRVKLDHAAKSKSSPKTKSSAKTAAKSRSTSASRKKPKTRAKTSPISNKSIKSVENTGNIDINQDISVSSLQKKQEESQNIQKQSQKVEDKPKKVTIVPLESVDFPGKSIPSGTSAAPIGQQSESGPSADLSVPPGVTQPRLLIKPGSPGYLTSTKTADTGEVPDAVKPSSRPSLRLIRPDIAPPPKPPDKTEPIPPAHPSVPKHPEDHSKVALRIRTFRPSTFHLIILVLAVVGILATLMIVRPGAHATSDPIPEPSGIYRVAVLDIINDTGDRQQNTWSQALGLALTSDLSQAESFHMIPGDQVFFALQDLNMLDRSGEYSLQNLQNISRRTGAFYFVQGRVLKHEGAPAVFLEIKEASKGRSLFSQQFDSVNQDNFLTRVDDLAKHIRENLPLPEERLKQGPDRAFLDAVTAVPQAFELYTQGKRQFWLRDFRGSIDAFEKAIVFDPEFAPAYIGAADAYDALGYFHTGWKKAQAAQRLVDRLTELDRLHLQAEFYRRSEKTFDIAQKVYSRILELDPEDTHACSQLGNLYYQLGESEKARACFEQSKKNLIFSPLPYLGLSLLDIKKKDFAGALNQLNSFSTNNPENEDIRYQIAAVLLLKGQYDQALEEVKRNQKIYPAFKFSRLKGELLLMKGDVKTAENEFNKLLQDPEPLGSLWGRKRLADLFMLGGRFNSARSQLSSALELAETHQAMAWKYRLHLDLARNYLESGSPAKAMTECDSAWSIAVQGETMDLPREALHVRGLCYLALNRLRDAQRTAERLRGLCEKGPTPDRMRYFYHLMGRIEMFRNNYSQAVTHFSRAVNLLPPQELPGWGTNDHALFVDALAEAYYADENPIKALEEFENVRDLSSGRLSYGDLYARIFYKLGKIREEYGLHDIASDIYRKFLVLWQDADPGLLEKRDAEKRLRAVLGR